MDDDNAIAVLIPAYNEVQTIEQIVNACSCYTQRLIVVDDGSTDGTASLLQHTAATVVSHKKNLGKGAALLAGFRIAVAQCAGGVITIDADGQHNPADLPHFLSLISSSPDTLIIGARRLAAQAAPKKRLYANKIADFFISLAAQKRLYDTQSGYRYYPISFLKKYLTNTEKEKHFAFESDILISAVKAGVPIAYVNIESCYPVGARASHYRVRKDTWEIAKTIFRMIVKPTS
ncbi:MAG: glycosyltransferase family 2 protein [Gammaproteobacteria bacterium CG_4_10_14_0_8_um_filter_38_16]|nr:MAG: glycosyltransferase family 2 protein [Gammaproteobacteria bacterium CG_4_10_14_0_8_um_filter_38_16]PJA03846.1 MAG: glycosyltransferase family 2 protein [Gammaproteobacteria bacterium CG_4_10_14_0_2_um_filter_38_22]PJB10820.1 MAG: glycosyltransferase family 2 protein [Gammaproteobacteria bacterium CG_4_9_14_3_um_filter_38_9]